MKDNETFIREIYEKAAKKQQHIEQERSIRFRKKRWLIQSACGVATMVLCVGIFSKTTIQDGQLNSGAFLPAPASIEESQEETGMGVGEKQTDPEKKVDVRKKDAKNQEDRKGRSVTEHGDTTEQNEFQEKKDSKAQDTVSQNQTSKEGQELVSGGETSGKDVKERSVNPGKDPSKEQKITRSQDSASQKGEKNQEVPKEEREQTPVMPNNQEQTNDPTTSNNQDNQGTETTKGEQEPAGEQTSDGVQVDQREQQEQQPEEEPIVQGNPMEITALVQSVSMEAEGTKGTAQLILTNEIARWKKGEILTATFDKEQFLFLLEVGKEYTLQLCQMSDGTYTITGGTNGL